MRAHFGCFDNCGQLLAPADVATAAARLAKAALVALTLVIGGATTQAQTVAALPSASKVVEKSTAKPVLAWTRFCERHPGECAVDLAEPATVTMTPETWRTIMSVNRRVNTRIRPMTDKAHWGVVDSWDFPDDGAGDCEDYQLLKRRMLVERGLPRRAMRMTVVIDELNEGHAVLMIRTDRGDYILDNKTSVVLPWEQTGYVFVKREGAGQHRLGVLGGVTSPVSTANR